MDAVYSILLVLALALPLRWAVLKQVHEGSPQFFRRYGVISSGSRRWMPSARWSAATWMRRSTAAWASRA